MAYKVSILGKVSILTMTLLGCSQPSLPRDSQTVDGTVVYLGVVPAEIVRGHPTEPSDPDALHGGTEKNVGSHHVLIALFDAQSGARIADADVRVGVGALASDRYDAEKELTAMQINDTVTYGNFLPLSGPGPWRIHVVIRRAGLQAPIAADFEYEHPSGQ